MKINLNELTDMFDNISSYEYIVYDKKENEYIFVDEMFMGLSEYKELMEKFEFDEENRYFFLPNKYIFHDSEIAEEYIYSVRDGKVQNELEYSFCGKERYRKFKETLRRYKLLDDYYSFRENYLKNMAIEWCKKYNFEYE